MTENTTTNSHLDRRDLDREGSMPSVLIAGCGQLGIEAGIELHARGCRVFGLRRSPERLPAEIEGLGADLGSPDLGGNGAEESLPTVDVLIYVLAADAFEDEAYRRAYVDGLGHLLAALERRRALPRRLVYVSSTSVYAQTDGSRVDEDSPTEPSAFSGRRLLEGEALARGAAVDQRAVIRFAGIYGPSRTFLLRSVKSGKAVCFDEPVVFTNRIHSSDAAASLVHLALAPEISGIYIGVDREPATDGEVKRWLADRLGVPHPPSAHQLPPGEERPQLRNRRRTNKRCSGKRLLDSGFELAFPDYRAGYGSIIDQQRKSEP